MKGTIPVRQPILSESAVAIDVIVNNAKTHAETVVITGGEPLTWDMTALTQRLKDQNLRVHIETSGAYPVTGHWDWFCLSPKKTKVPVQEAYAIAHEFITNTILFLQKNKRPK